jgi:ABC-type proline/glycine betaine transport system permease subunit
MMTWLGVALKGATLLFLLYEVGVAVSAWRTKTLRSWLCWIVACMACCVASEWVPWIPVVALLYVAIVVCAVVGIVLGVKENTRESEVMSNDRNA